MKNKTIQKLLTHAQTMQKKAYAPYSNFYVGAALQTNCNNIIGGCNIESASYGLTMCAERVAIFQALSQGYRDFTHLILVSETGASPCGACRQIIFEFAPNASIIIAKPDKIIQELPSKDLLPYAFCNKDLACLKKGNKNEPSK